LPKESAIWLCLQQNKCTVPHDNNTNEKEIGLSHSTACDFAALSRGMFVHALKTLHEQDNDL